MATQSQQATRSANTGLANNNSQATINELIAKMKPQFERALPKHMPVERLMRVALTTIGKNPKLGQCTPVSLLSCLMDCASLGLEPDNVLGRAYLIPYGNVCTLIIGYKGLIELAMRSGRVSSLMAQVIRENDEFDYEFGPDGFLRHKPLLRGDRGKVIGAYAFVKFKDGAQGFDIMSIEDLYRIRARSKAATSGPWKTDEDEMFRKTVLKRLSKYVPLSPEFMDAVSRDNEYESEPTKIITPIFKDESGNVIAKSDAQDATFTDAEASALLSSTDETNMDEKTGELL